MGAPQIIVICIYAATIGIALAKQKDLGMTVLGLVGMCALLWWGGFWG